MTKISDLSCIGKNGKKIYGTAAVLHRIFSHDIQEDELDKEAEMEEYVRILRELGYGYFDE